KPKRSWPFLAETSAAARARRSLTEMWSTTTFTPFFWPHSGQYFLSNHSSNAGTKCVHCPILSVSDLARAERTMMVGETTAAVATEAPLRKVRRGRVGVRESSLRGFPFRRWGGPQRGAKGRRNWILEHPQRGR